MTARAKVPKVLHCHSTFAAGGKELRAVQLMNAFGEELEHTVVSGMPEEMGARDHIAQGVTAHFPESFPSLTGKPTPWRLAELAKAMRGFDLVLTYNWGAMDVALAHRVFAGPMKLPPLIHHEDGFNEDETEGLKTSRNWMRRIALGKAHKLVVPSRVLEQIALGPWQQPRSQVQRISNGIDTAAFAAKPKPSGLPIAKGEGESWVGTLAGLRPVKRLPLLVDACAGLPDNWKLVIFGQGPEETLIRCAAEAHGTEDRVLLPGSVSDPANVVGLFDIFALSSRSEQFPLSVVEAMAAGLPVAAPAVGDILSIVSEPNRPLIAPPGDTEALSRTISKLAADPNLRAEIGAANQAKARSHFDQSRMVEAYRALYWGAMAGKR